MGSLGLKARRARHWTCLLSAFALGAIVGPPALQGQCGPATLSTLEASFPKEGGLLPVVITYTPTPYCPCAWRLSADSGYGYQPRLPSRRSIGDDPANPTQCIWDSGWDIPPNDGPPATGVLGFYNFNGDFNSLSQSILIVQDGEDIPVARDDFGKTYLGT